jgi:FkbM family methyltransferase
LRQAIRTPPFPGGLQETTMQSVGRRLAFVLASSNHGTMIVNRFDYRMIDAQNGYGVGFQILETASFDPTEVKLAVDLLALRRKHYGDGVVAFDCGANIGVHTVEWAMAMTGWGSVVSIEAQERVYYALAGNIAINNCFNAIAVHGAISSESGVMKIPSPDYFVPSSFGSLELRQRSGNEFIGQPIDYENTVNVRKLTLDEFNLPRVDFIKIDVEGMELEALEGAKRSITQSHPIMLIEKIKTDAEKLRAWLKAHGYEIIDAGINMLAIHQSDKTLTDVHVAPVAQPAA